MIKKTLLAAVMVASFAAAGFVSTKEANAELFVRRPNYGVYMYYNGPPKAFIGPPVRIHSSAWDIGPYGPGYGWPYTQPTGFRMNIGH